MTGELVGRSIHDDPIIRQEPPAQVDLEVRYDKRRLAWLLEPWQDEPDLGPDDPARKVFDVCDTKDEAIKIGRVLREVYAESINASGSCELYIRHRNGRIGKDRTTGGRDPEGSEG